MAVVCNGLQRPPYGPRGMTVVAGVDLPASWEIIGREQQVWEVKHGANRLGLLRRGPRRT